MEGTSDRKYWALVLCVVHGASMVLLDIRYNTMQYWRFDLIE
jgi:hypothetical protein